MQATSPSLPVLDPPTARTHQTTQELTYQLSFAKPGLCSAGHEANLGSQVLAWV